MLFAASLSDLICLSMWVQKMHTTCHHFNRTLHTLFTQSHSCDIFSSQHLLFFTTISDTSLLLVWWVLCLCCLFSPPFHWLDQFAAVWFPFVSRMYQPAVPRSAYTFLVFSVQYIYSTVATRVYYQKYRGNTIWCRSTLCVLHLTLTPLLTIALPSQSSIATRSKASFCDDTILSFHFGETCIKHGGLA